MATVWNRFSSTSHSCWRDSIGCTFSVLESTPTPRHCAFPYFRSPFFTPPRHTPPQRLTAQRGSPLLRVPFFFSFLFLLFPLCRRCFSGFYDGIFQYETRDLFRYIQHEGIWDKNKTEVLQYEIRWSAILSWGLSRSNLAGKVSLRPRRQQSMRWSGWTGTRWRREPKVWIENTFNLSCFLSPCQQQSCDKLHFRIELYSGNPLITTPWKGSWHPAPCPLTPFVNVSFGLPLPFGDKRKHVRVLLSPVTRAMSRRWKEQKPNFETSQYRSPPPMSLILRYPIAFRRSYVARLSTSAVLFETFQDSAPCRTILLCILQHNTWGV